MYSVQIRKFEWRGHTTLMYPTHIAEVGITFMSRDNPKPAVWPEPIFHHLDVRLTDRVLSHLNSRSLQAVKPVD